jgi:hypothetical protein
MDAERALIAFATPAPGPADLNQVSYWSNWSAEFDPELAATHAQHIRIAAAAYSRPAWRVAHWRDTAEAAVRAARAAPADGYVSTQNHVLSVPDFVLTLVVEATIHHLDLIVNLPAPSPTAGNLRLVRRTLTELAADISGQPARSALARTGWDDTTLALKATGRLALTEHERADPRCAGQPLPVIPLICPALPSPRPAADSRCGSEAQRGFCCSAGPGARPRCYSDTWVAGRMGAPGCRGWTIPEGEYEPDEHPEAAARGVHGGARRTGPGWGADRTR